MIVTKHSEVKCDEGKEYQIIPFLGKVLNNLHHLHTRHARGPATFLRAGDHTCIAPGAVLILNEKTVFFSLTHAARPLP
jgi:hypothetical protein